MTSLQMLALGSVLCASLAIAQTTTPAASSTTGQTTTTTTKSKKKKAAAGSTTTPATTTAPAAAPAPSKTPARPQPRRPHLPQPPHQLQLQLPPPNQPPRLLLRQGRSYLGRYFRCQVERHGLGQSEHQGLSRFSRQGIRHHQKRKVHDRSGCQGSRSPRSQELALQSQYFSTAKERPRSRILLRGRSFARAHNTCLDPYAHIRIAIEPMATRFLERASIALEQP